MGVSATMRKDCGRWFVTAQRKGLKRSKLAPVGMTSKLEAMAKVGDELIALIEAELVATPDPSRPQTLTNFCATVYREKRKEHGVGDRTWRQRKYKVAGIMVDLGELRLDEVTTPVVTKWLSRLAKEGAPLKVGGRGLKLGAEARNDYLVTLRSIFQVAVFNGHIEKVPFANMPAPIDLTTDREGWTHAMKARLLATSLKMDEGIFRLARGLMLTGCRPEELLRLRWIDVVDIPVPMLKVMGKNEKRRNLPLTGKLGEFIRSIPRTGRAIFPVERGKTKGGRYAFWPQKRWEEVCEAAEVPSVAYDLRHTFITEMIVAQVPMAFVAKWVGNSVRVIEQRYSHLSPDHLKGMAELVGRGLDAAAPTSKVASTAGGPQDEIALLAEPLPEVAD